TEQSIDHLKQTIPQLAVMGKLVPQNPNDEPAADALAKINTERERRLAEGSINKVKPLPELDDEEHLFEAPRNWEWVRVTDVFDVSCGITKNSKRAPVKNHFPYLRVANVQRGRLDLTEIKRFELVNGELERWHLEPRDLLVVEGNGSEDEIGRCAVWDGELNDCVHQNHIIRCRPIGHDGQDFTLRFFNSPAGINEMKARAITTSGLYSLSVGKIRSLVMPFPPLSEQKRIVSKVTHLLSQVTRLESTLTRRESTRTQLLAAAIHAMLTDREAAT
ncbi:MAG: restriction endonuclease subunit S, partial [Rhodopirellula sp.]|nr:restriction endonuclease subunit S [Rhodopirellula sp.]